MNISINSKLTSKSMHQGFRKAFIQNKDLPLEARFLLILLMTYKGLHEYCYPSQGTLAKILNRNTDSVRKYMNILEQEGYVKIKSRGIGRSLNYAPSYFKISVGTSQISKQPSKPPVIIREEPPESVGNRSISSRNIVKTLSGKELFEQKRRELFQQ